MKINFSNILLGSKNVWIRIFGPILLLIGFYIFIRFLPPMEGVICTYYEENKKTSYEGVVIDKYIDSLNHGYPMIVFDEGYKGFDRMDYTHDISGLFEFIQVGDKIVKKKDTHDIVIERENKKTIFTLDYGCQ